MKLNRCKNCGGDNIRLVIYFGRINQDGDVIDTNDTSVPRGYYFECGKCHNASLDSDSIEYSVFIWNNENSERLFKQVLSEKIQRAKITLKELQQLKKDCGI